jgi:mRNA interferase MazF
MPTFETVIPLQWNVVVLPFPYSDRLAEKRRPAVVVSAPRLAERHGIIWVAMITSAENAGWQGDIPLLDLQHAGLASPSVIRPAKLATVDVSRVIRTAGKLRNDEVEAFLARYREMLGEA